ncbi:hypothetical protein WA171_002805 [Blastocystis sp. BT1]
MITIVVMTLLGILSAIALGLTIRLVIFGVDACFQYHRTGRNPWGSRSTTIYSGEVTVDTLRNYYTQIGKNDIRSMEGVSLDDSCAVCLETFADSSDLVKLNACEHVFHRSCIEEWILTHPLCPLCKRDIRDMSTDCLTKESDRVYITISVSSSHDRRVSASHTISFN